MALSDNPFFGLPLVDLIELQTFAVQALKDVLTAGQSYTFPGRSFTRANLPELRETLAEINVAINATPGGSMTGISAKQIAQATIDTQSRFAG